MEYRRLGRSDLSVSSVGLGCATFGREIDEPTSFAVMDHALERGITLIDTAEAYSAGRSEEIVGNWLAQRQVRNKVVLATKVSVPLTGQRILASAEASLRRLQTEVVDLYQLHAWDDSVPLEETLEALNTLVVNGKVRYIGCSNFTASQLRQALSLHEVNGWARMEAIQPHYNLVGREIERELLPLCADQEVGAISYSPLGAGFLTGKVRRGGAIAKGTRLDIVPSFRDYYFHDDGFRIMEGLRASAEASGRSMVQLALAWVFGQPHITSVLIGARTLSHVDQALQAQATGLSPDLREELSNL